MLSTRVRIIRRVIVLAFAVALVAAPAAYAQTTTTTPPYPGPTPTTTPPDPTSADTDYGEQALGAVLNVVLCNFQPGSTVTSVTLITGRTIALTPGLVADARGCIALRLEVLRTLVALGVLPARMLGATGLAQTADKIQISVNGQVITAGPSGTVVKVVSQGTGANGAARTVSFRFTAVRKTTSSVVRTGTTLVRWTPLGAGLVGIGYLLVLATRRRRTADL